MCVCGCGYVYVYVFMYGIGGDILIEEFGNFEFDSGERTMS